MKLTAKQRKFIDSYVECGNATQAALDAGYAKKAAYQSGAENLKKPQIKTAIEKRMKEIESAKIMNATEALQLLTAIGRGETKETVVISTPVGVRETEKEADLKTRISAIKEILKRYPNTDPITEQQLRKLKAEVRLAESKIEDNEKKLPEIIIHDSWGRSDGN